MIDSPSRDEVLALLGMAPPAPAEAAPAAPAK